MIKLEHTVTASPEQMEFIIEGMRNPMNSWEKSDSFVCSEQDPRTLDELEAECEKCPFSENSYEKCPRIDDDIFIVGKNDLDLMTRLRNAGTDHRKFMRMMPVYVRITAPLYWWKEFDTYKVGTVSNSCSTMHKIHAKAFTLDDFSHEHLMDDDDLRDNNPNDIKDGCWESPYYLFDELMINTLNKCRKRYLKTNDKKYWWQLIQLLPSSYNQTRNIMMNYEVLANIYPSRKGHKLDEWKEFCKWIEGLPYSELITGLSMKDIPICNEIMAEAEKRVKEKENLNG